VKLRVALFSVSALAFTAHADGLVIVGGSPRAIGRAGTGTVGDDGGGALLLDPAAMARRDSARGQVGVTYIDDGIDWRSDLGSNAPIVHDQIGSLAMPTVSVEDGYAGWVFGIGAMTSAISDRQLRRVDSSGQANAFDYRYAGIGGGVRRDTVVVGAARRIGDHVAVGASIAASHVTVAETRRVWAGFSGTDALGSPNDDVQLELAATDRFSPSAVVGVLVAPDAPIELAASIGWERDAHASGTVFGFGSTNAQVRVPNDAASIVLPQPVTARAGVRYLADRYVVECDGDLFVFGSGSTSNTWSLAGVDVTNTGTQATMTSLVSRFAPRTHAAFRTSVDVALIGGFLWATAGYAYTTEGTPEADYTPTVADLGGHTIGVGIEAHAGGFTVTLGASRTWSGAIDVASPAWNLDNPLGKGDEHVAPGDFAAVTTQFGVMLDAELDAPR
jgi:hypothetical protein